MKTIYLFSIVITSILTGIKILGYCAGIYKILTSEYDRMREENPLLPSKKAYLLGCIEHLAYTVVIIVGWIILNNN